MVIRVFRNNLFRRQLHFLIEVRGFPVSHFVIFLHSNLTVIKVSTTKTKSLTQRVQVGMAVFYVVTTWQNEPSAEEMKPGNSANLSNTVWSGSGKRTRLVNNCVDREFRSILIDCKQHLCVYVKRLLTLLSRLTPLCIC